jgi:hypothetical protein
MAGGYENAVQRLKRRKFITLLGGADDGAKWQFCDEKSARWHGRSAFAPNILVAGILARVTSPSLVNLQALLERLNRTCRSRIGPWSACREPLALQHKAVLVLLGESADGADDFVDQRPKLHGRGGRPQSWRGRALG